ncbi:MAG TPA: glutaredoxin 3 [Agitococcus sp.]|jgi:glutaredoxin 3|nr:glutaredoxin 3 [Moraxellaceae bacterium]MBK8327620.1 glutaredoxin 3 [Moraxellaceae bacterium]MBK9185895.1 glutaredoxin 3 [Moraxellaceae bacterium]MCC6375157.1 glutaredoxin 3 [Moraxellaceae bacterium]HQV80898.1 glutaredoxin 3 [Agitococcus sp.]
MAKVVIYTTRICPYCVRAKQLFQRKGINYEEIDVSLDNDLRIKLVERTKQRTVPQIFINDQHIGGCDDLYALERQGALDPLLAQ